MSRVQIRIDNFAESNHSFLPCEYRVSTRFGWIIIALSAIDCCVQRLVCVLSCLFTLFHHNPRSKQVITQCINIYRYSNTRIPLCRLYFIRPRRYLLLSNTACSAITSIVLIGCAHSLCRSECSVYSTGREESAKASKHTDVVVYRNPRRVARRKGSWHNIAFVRHLRRASSRRLYGRVTSELQRLHGSTGGDGQGQATDGSARLCHACHGRLVFSVGRCKSCVFGLTD